MPQNILSFSSNFKIQYFSREKIVRDEIDTLLKQIVQTVKYLQKNGTPYQKIKIRLKIQSSCEQLVLLITPTPRIIVKKLE